jgi:hypothetical protein
MLQALELTHTSSDFDEPIKFRVVSSLHTADGKPKEGGFGIFHVTIPPKAVSGIVGKHDRLIYVSNLLETIKLDATHYIGLENSIVGAHSTCIAPQGLIFDFQAFRLTDPFVQFALAYERGYAACKSTENMKVLNGDDLKDDIVLMKRSWMREVCNFFQDALFPLYMYLDNPGIELSIEEWPMRDNRAGMASFTLEATYVVVNRTQQATSAPIVKSVILK